jgi:hypothetical protein
MASAVCWQATLRQLTPKLSHFIRVLLEFAWSGEEGAAPGKATEAKLSGSYAKSNNKNYRGGNFRQSSSNGWPHPYILRIQDNLQLADTQHKFAPYFGRSNRNPALCSSVDTDCTGVEDLMLKLISFLGFFLCNNAAGRSYRP